MYRVFLSKSYKRALKRIRNSKGFKINELEKIIESLANGQKLDLKYKDHVLKGDMAGYRECHIQNDVLLVYLIDDDQLVLVLVDIGTHASLFG